MGLPKAVLLRRIDRELKDCEEYLGSEFEFDAEKAEFPIRIDMHMSNVMAHETADRIITEHDFYIVLTEDYGFKKPEVRWKTQIFHPNIMDPSDGGYVCTKMLNEWEFNTRLPAFLKSLSFLVSNPNPMSPFGTESCMEAARFFADHDSKFRGRVEYGSD